MLTTDTLLAQAAAGEITLINGELPTNLQWMPPGKQVVQPMGFPEPFAMEVTPAVAAAADQQLQQMLTDFAQGKDVEPYIDINHEDKARAFLPKKISWGGDDLKSGGIRVEGQWTGGGARAAKDGEQNVISPSWLLHKVTKAFLGVKHNLGGLVPRSAFHGIQAFAKADHQPPQNKTTMTDQEIQDAIANAIQPLADRLTALEPKEKSKPDDTSSDKNKTSPALAHAKRTVEEIGIRGGRIASQDTGTIEFWTQAVAADANAIETLAKMAVNPAFVQIVNARGARTITYTRGSGAEDFANLVLAKAKSSRETDPHKIRSLAVDQAIAENPAAYQSWREAEIKPELKFI